MWDLSPGAEYYTVEGGTQQGLMVSCTTYDTYCAMYNMVCGQMYIISVTAHNHVCQGVSTSNESVILITGEKTVKWKTCFFSTFKRCTWTFFKMTYNLEILV